MKHLALSFMIATLPGLAGCATPELWSAAEGLDQPVMKLEVLRVRSAQRSENGTVGVCLQVRDLESRAVRDMTLHIPVDDRTRLRVRNLPAQDADSLAGSRTTSATVHVEFRPEPDDLTLDCRSDDRPIVLLHSSIGPKICDPDPAQVIQSRLRLPHGISEAVYVLNRHGHPANIGYLATRPVVSSSHAIDIPANYLRSVRPRGEANPYLYLLTPVTVIVDTAIVAVFTVAWAHSPGSPNIDFSCSSAVR